MRSTTARPRAAGKRPQAVRATSTDGCPKRAVNGVGVIVGSLADTVPTLCSVNRRQSTPIENLWRRVGRPKAGAKHADGCTEFDLCSWKEGRRIDASSNEAPGSVGDLLLIATGVHLLGGKKTGSAPLGCAGEGGGARAARNPLCPSWVEVRSPTIELSVNHDITRGQLEPSKRR